MTVLATAPWASFRAVGSLGRSIGGAGMGSKPTKTAGRPVLSRSRPSSTANSDGAGSSALRTRIARDVWAASVRRGTGPKATRPPTSQTMSTACAMPTTEPKIRSAAPSTPVPRPVATRRPIVDPIDSPRATAISSAGQDEERAERRLDRVELVGEEREADDHEACPADGPDEAPDLGERAGTESEKRSDDDQQDRDQVQRVHRPIVAQEPDSRCPGPWCRAASPPRARRRLADGHLDGCGPALAVAIVYVPGSTSPRSTCVCLVSAISMQMGSPGPRPSNRVSVNESGALLDDDVVEHVARLDAARPRGRDDAGSDRSRPP